MSFLKKNKDIISEDSAELNRIFLEGTHPTADALSEKEILNSSYKSDAPVPNSALDSLKKRMLAGGDEKISDEKNESLLNKCKPYVIDDDGSDASINKEPLYKLQSVAEILKSESSKAIEQLSKKYDLLFEDLENDNTKPENEEEKNGEPITQISNVQSNIPFVISDIDIVKKVPDVKDISQTATVTFTPVAASDTTKAINVSSKTMPIDLTGELVKLPQTGTDTKQEEVSLEENDFEEFNPDTEYASSVDYPRLRRIFSIKKRNAFLGSIATFLLALVLIAFQLPFINNSLTDKPLLFSVLGGSIIFCGTLANLSMFGALKGLLKIRSNTDILSSLSAIATLLTAIFAIAKKEPVNELLIFTMFVLFARSLTRFFHYSTHLSNITLLASNKPKYAVKLIGDSALTSAMAKSSINGDVLIAATQKTDFVSNYMKYSTFSSVLSGKLVIITISAILLSLIFGISTFSIYQNTISALYSAAAILCFANIPTVFMIDNLPLYRASKKLAEKGAVIAGKTGAEQLEMPNAVVLSSHDFFPQGTITLHRLEVLSQNNLEDTIVRAAALTEYIGSTLTPIFKSITKSGNITTLPDADTVKYEDRLGISGWVDNRLLFIGNRTLMETHGIAVPPVDVDKKILREGYFPIYVATKDKASALLVVQYNVDRNIASELKTLTKLGVTVLVNNTDPNLSEEMICDYFGLYRDTVMVMSAAGSYIYKNATVPIEKISAPAMCRNNPLALASLINSANKIKRSNLILTTLYVVCAVLGVLVFAYTSYGGQGTLMKPFSLLIYGLISTVLSYFIYLTERP